MSQLRRIFSHIHLTVGRLMREVHGVTDVFVDMDEEVEGYYFHLLNSDETPFCDFHLFVRYDSEDNEFEVQMLEFTEGGPISSSEQLQAAGISYVHNERKYCAVNKIEEHLCEFFAHLVEIFEEDDE